MSLIINPSVARDHQGRCLDCKNSGIRLVASYSAAYPIGLFSTLSGIVTSQVYETCPCRTVVISPVTVTGDVTPQGR
jgi:hypothetical protein